MKTTNLNLGFIGIFCLISITAVKGDTTYLHDGEISAENIMKALVPLENGLAPTKIVLKHLPRKQRGYIPIQHGRMTEYAKPPIQHGSYQQQAIPQRQPPRVVNKPQPVPRRQHKPKSSANNCGRSITLNIGFAKNSSRVVSRDKRKVSEMAKVLNNPVFKNCKIVVAGHTDQSGNIRTNILLSKNRAQSVVRSLQRYGIARYRLRSVGYGPRRLYDKAHPNSPVNRRVEFKLR